MTNYPSFEALCAGEVQGRDYRIRCRHGQSEIAVMAIHGGGIEPGTTEIAEAIAGIRHTFYTFSGLKRRGNFVLHITSREFDEPIGLSIAAGARTVLSIHGCRDKEKVVYLGGRHRRLREHMGTALEAAGFSVRSSDRFPGIHPKNICNRCRGGQGVQLEISSGLRQVLFEDPARPHRKRPTQQFDIFVGALKSAMAEKA